MRVLIALVLMLSVAPAAHAVQIGPVGVVTPAPVAIPDIQGPDIPPAGQPFRTLYAITGARFTCGSSSDAKQTVHIPDAGPYTRVIAEIDAIPEGDPWDRLLQVFVGGHEVFRATTPRTAATYRRDLTEYLPLFAPGTDVEVEIQIATYVGDIVGNVRLQLFKSDPTSRLVRAPASGVVPLLRGATSGRNTSTAGANVSISGTVRALEVTMSGHGQDGEFWWMGTRVPPEFQLRVVGEPEPLMSWRAAPYVYALLGFGNANSNTACNGSGTSLDGDIVHPVMWWSAHRALEAAGIHTGNGQVPPYRLNVSPELSSRIMTANSFEVVQISGASGDQHWPVTVSALLG